MMPLKCKDLFFAHEAFIKTSDDTPTTALRLRFMFAVWKLLGR